MRLDVKPPISFCWEALNSALADQQARAFYSFKPYTVGDRRLAVHESIELLASPLRQELVPLAMEVYLRYCPPTPLQRYLSEYGAGFCSYVSPEGFMSVLTMSEELDFVLRQLGPFPRAFAGIQAFVDWYSTKRTSLELVNWASFPFSPLASCCALFDALVGHARETGQFTGTLFLRTTPAWFSFVRLLKQKYGVELTPTDQQVTEARALRNTPKLEYVLLEKPPQYFTWGFKQKFMWDMSNNKDFRDFIFKQDKELAEAWLRFNGDINAFEDWVRSRE